MFDAIKKFLALHHYLSLPGIGSFKVETLPAHIDFTERSIVSSKSKIVFTKEIIPAEKNFFAFISNELHVDELQAIKSFTNFTSKIQSDLDRNNVIHLKGIGILNKQDPDEILFQPEEMPDYFPTLTAEKVIRKNTTHLIRVGEEEKTSEEMHTALQQPEAVKKERWWIAATILAVIGIAAIAFYYVTNK